METNTPLSLSENVTGGGGGGQSHNSFAALDNLYRVLYSYALPTICVFGSLGNVLNLLILTGKRIQHSLRSVERSANVGLIALALSDLLFCLSVFPSTFLPQDLVFDRLGFLAYYGCYCAAVINVFIMTSTWLTVAMSVERYLAICHPLKSRQIITLKRTKSTIVVAFFVSGVFNLPVFWRYSIVRTPAADNATATAAAAAAATYRVEPTSTDKTFDHAYRGLWSALGNFVPLFLLLVCNAALLREIHHSYALRRSMNGHGGGGGWGGGGGGGGARGTPGVSSSSSPARGGGGDQDSSSSRITVTLVSIVIMFFLLVAPSEIVKQIVYVVDGDLSGNYTYMVIELITNLMQTINFSANFILYCIVNPSFRKTMWRMLGFRFRRMLSVRYSDESKSFSVSMSNRNHHQGQGQGQGPWSIREPKSSHPTIVYSVRLESVL